MKKGPEHEECSPHKRTVSSVSSIITIVRTRYHREGKGGHNVLDRTREIANSIFRYQTNPTGPDRPRPFHSSNPRACVQYRLPHQLMFAVPPTVEQPSISLLIPKKQHDQYAFPTPLTKRTFAEFSYYRQGEHSRRRETDGSCCGSGYSSPNKIM